MNNHVTTHPAKYATHVGTHRLVGWGEWSSMAESVLPRVFGFMVQVATPNVQEYHGDLFTDAAMLRAHLDAVLGTEGNTEAFFDYCVRYSGTNFGNFARFMFDSLAYDTALYRFRVFAVGGEWWLDITLLDARPDRPE